MDKNTIRIRDRRTEKRYFVDNIIVDDYGPIIGPYGLAIYNVLVRHSHGDTGRNSWPSHKIIAYKAGCSVTKVKEIINQLIELKLIIALARFEKDGGQTSNEYCILEPPAMTDTPPQVSVVTTKNPPSFKNPPSIPPPEKAEAERPAVKANIHRLLQATKTIGEDDPIQRSPLAEYIGQQFNSPVPSGQCNKLAIGFTEHLPGGETVKHPAPDELWLDNPKFPEWVEGRIKYLKGNAGGSNARMRARAVNAICQYKGSPWAWLEWLERQDTPPVFLSPVEAEARAREPTKVATERPPLPEHLVRQGIRYLD